MENNKEQYNLYTEKIKQSPFEKYKLLFDLGKLVLKAVFTGIIIALTFLAIMGLYWDDDKQVENQRKEVNIPLDEEPDKNITQVEPDDKNITDGNGNATESIIRETDLYSRVEDIIASVSASVTTVTAVAENEDPLFSVIQNSVDYPGIIIADNEVEYLVLTDAAIADANLIRVTLNDGKVIPASFVMADRLLDMAIIAIGHEELGTMGIQKLPIITMGNSYMLKQGELVVSVGNLFGIHSAVDFGMVVNSEQVLYEADSRHRMIYTNMHGAKSCSGFLFNEDGEVVGFISKNNSVQNVVAYGISDIKVRIQNITNNRRIGYMGVIGLEVDEKHAELHKIPVGVCVTSIRPDSPAYNAGIINGDIITDISGRTITNLYNIERAMCEFEPGTQVTVTVYRKGKKEYVPMEFTVTLGER